MRILFFYADVVEGERYLNQLKKMGDRGDLIFEMVYSPEDFQQKFQGTPPGIGAVILDLARPEVEIKQAVQFLQEKSSGTFRYALKADPSRGSLQGLEKLKNQLAVGGILIQPLEPQFLITLFKDLQEVRQSHINSI